MTPHAITPTTSPIFPESVSFIFNTLVLPLEHPGPSNTHRLTLRCGPHFFIPKLLAVGVAAGSWSVEAATPIASTCRNSEAVVFLVASRLPEQYKFDNSVVNMLVVIATNFEAPMSDTVMDLEANASITPSGMQRKRLMRFERRATRNNRK
jgi:hypothetical protein